MKYIMCSRVFPAGHPRQGQPTFFVERILNSFHNGQMGLDNICQELKEFINDFELIANQTQKHHTIRAGSRFKPGEMVSLRVWSGRPYCSKQIEFAQVEVKKTLPVEINNRFGAASFEVVIDGELYGGLHYGNDKDLNKDGLELLSKNDGLELEDFIDLFNIHPKKTGLRFTGQIICWNESIEYGKPYLITEKQNNE